jgi:hypothetical protein
VLRRERQIALEPLHRLEQLAIDLSRPIGLRLHQQLQNFDQFRDLVFHGTAIKRFEVCEQRGEPSWPLGCWRQLAVRSSRSASSRARLSSTICSLALSQRPFETCP